MIIVTGGAGMIGSNLVKKLNSIGYEKILIIDNLKSGRKFVNLVDLKFNDFCYKSDFYDNLDSFKNIEVVFHLGACSDTTNWDGQYLLKNNYECSKNLFIWCQENSIPFIYASSASVYGINNNFKECSQNENPINMYAYSKLLFDQFVRRNIKNNHSQVVGLRYFNVYGPNEEHKKKMASTIFHFNNQVKISNEAKLFKGNDLYGNGEQSRDFVYVKDCAELNIWFFNNPQFSGIYNVGTGNSETFNSIANLIIKWHKKGKITYIDFPDNLLESYQNYTKADISSLQSIKCPIKFLSIQDGVNDYLDWLNK